MVGVMRRIMAIKKNRTPYDGIGGDTEWQADIVGAIGECILSKYLNIYWSPEVGKLDTEQGDVAGYQVRATSWRNGNLRIKKADDPEDIFVLVTGENTAALEWTIRGWCYGGDAQKEEYWVSKQKDRWAYFYPPELLEPIESLTQEREMG